MRDELLFTKLIMYSFGYIRISRQKRICIHTHTHTYVCRYAKRTFLYSFSGGRRRFFYVNLYIKKRFPSIDFCTSFPIQMFRVKIFFKPSLVFQTNITIAVLLYYNIVYVPSQRFLFHLQI